MSTKIQIRRGLKADLPVLDVGEFGLTTDTVEPELYVGTPTGNRKMTYDADKHAQLESNLAENTQETKAIKYQELSAPKAKMCIIDDDIMAEVWSVLKPISEEFGVPMVAAAPSAWVDTTACLTTDQLLYLQNTLGWEIASHTKSHVKLAEIPTAQLDEEIRVSKEELLRKGLNVQNMVYPFGSNNDVVRNMVSQYYNSATLAGGAYNKMPVENFRLRRMGFAYLTDTPQTGFPSDTSSLEYYKARLDEAVANNQPLIVMTHVKYPENTATQIQYLKDLIVYAQSLNVPIVTLQEIYETFGNAFEYQNSSGDYVRIAKTGKIYSPDLNAKMYEYTTNKYTNANVVHDFPYGKVTVSLSQNADNGGFPTGAGTLETHRQPDGDDFNFQIWYPYNTNQIFKRRWSTASSSWSAWEEFVTKTYVDDLSASRYKGMNFYTSASLNTDFPWGKVTTSYVDSTNSTGFPANAGVLITYRLSIYSNGWDRQIFMKHNTNQMWSRFALGSTGAWGTWTPITPLNGTTANRPTTYAKGLPYFDETLNKPIWRNATDNGWVDATGTTV